MEGCFRMAVSLLPALTLPAPTEARVEPVECGPMKLRVHGPGHDGRVIQILSAKCSVGSAAGCTLRLRRAGVPPLSCWILRGPQGTVVRRLNGNLTLNGKVLEEGSLQAGDRVRLGGVELEVVECRQMQLEESRASRLPPPPSPAVLAEFESRLAAANEKISKLEGEARQGFQSSITAAERADQLRDALAAAHQQLEEACRELTASHETMNHQGKELRETR